MANGGKTYSLSFIVFIKLLMIWFYLSMGGVIWKYINFFLAKPDEK